MFQACFFFLGRILVILGSCKSSRGRKGHLLHPLPRSTPAFANQVKHLLGDDAYLDCKHFLQSSAKGRLKGLLIVLKRNHVKNVIHSVNEEQTTLAFRQDLAFIFGQYQEPMSEICPEMHTTTKMAKMAKFRQQQLGGQCK